MEDIYKALFSPLWWFTAIFAGVIASLFASYLRTPIDNFLSRISSRWQKRTAKKEKEFEALVQKLRSDPTALLVVASERLGHLVTAQVGIVLVFLCLSLSQANHILRRINEEALKNPVFIGPDVVSSATSRLPEILFSLMAAWFSFSLVQHGVTGKMRLDAAIREARKAQTPDKE